MSLFCEHGRAEGQLCPHCIGVLDESGVQELQRLRMENLRLAELVSKADLVHIRLRDGLRRAVAIGERRVPSYAATADESRAIGIDLHELAELRKLVKP